MTGTVKAEEPAPAQAPETVQSRGVRSRREQQVLVLLVLAALLLALAVFEPSLNMGGDNAEYLVLGKALAEHRGYRIISEPGMPPETQRPPGYPALLAGLMVLFGQRLWLLKAVTCLLPLLASVWLSWRLLRCQGGSTAWVTAAAVWLFVFNYEILVLGSITGPEMVYTALTLGGLLAIVRFMGGRDTTIQVDRSPVTPADERRRLWWLTAAVVLTAAAVYARPNGITLLPAAGIYLALHRQWRALALSLLGVGALLAPLVLMQIRAADEGRTYLSHMNTIETEAGDREVRGPLDLLRRSAGSAVTQTLNLGQLLIVRPQDWSLRPRPVVEVASREDETPARGAADSASGLSPLRLLRRSSRYVLGLLALLGFVVSWRGRGSVMHWYLLMNMGLLVLSPFPRGRYLLPMLPMWGWLLGMSGVWIGERFRGAAGRRIGYSLLLTAMGAATIFTAVGTLQRGLHNYECRGLPAGAPGRYALDGSDFVNYVQTARWVAERTAPNAVVACRKPANMYLMSGRLATWAPLWQEQPAGVWQSLQDLRQYGPVYVVQDGFVNRYHGDITRRNLEPALRARRADLDPVLTLHHPETVVWRLREPPPAEGGGTARAAGTVAP